MLIYSTVLTLLHSSKFGFTVSSPPPPMVSKPIGSTAVGLGGNLTQNTQIVHPHLDYLSKVWVALNHFT
jgi:hypothetical protein